jgi:hypothetical protein
VVSGRRSDPDSWEDVSPNALASASLPLRRLPRTDFIDRWRERYPRPPGGRCDGPTSPGAAQSQPQIQT